MTSAPDYETTAHDLFRRVAQLAAEGASVGSIAVELEKLSRLIQEERARVARTRGTEL